MPGKNLVFQLRPKMLSTNQIPVFAGQQYLWKESRDLLDFLQEGSYQKKHHVRMPLLAGCSKSLLVTPLSKPYYFNGFFFLFFNFKSKEK